MIGYAANSYRLWDPSKSKVIEKRDVVFDENDQPNAHKIWFDLLGNDLKQINIKEDIARTENPNSVILKKIMFMMNQII